MGLRDRGRLVEGAAADVLVFAPEAFTDHADYAAPAQYASGLEHCIVGGRVAVEHDELTGVRAGAVLRRT